MDTRKRIFASERAMQARWAVSAGLCMETGGGESVRVVYPGIPAGSSGPDYKDAVVVFEQGGLTCGDVELHLRGRDWHRHGHDKDPAYNRVVLHVVGDSCGGALTHLSGGGEVPVVVLDPLEPVWDVSALPCSRIASRERESVRSLLARAGVARLLSRAARLAAEMAQEEYWMILAQRTARALGYSANGDVSSELARSVMSPVVLPLVSGTDGERRRVLMVGMAGLLPSQRLRAGLVVAGEMPKWESLWDEVEGHAPSLPPSLWKMSGLYPNNSPVRRVVALADLWPRFERLAETAAGQIVHDLERPRGCALALEREFRLSGETYWRHHYDFGLRTRESHIVGGAKAREIVVNALLPCVAAAAMVSGDLSRLSAVVQLLSAYPPAPAHAVTRHMQRQLGLMGGGFSAAEQQGMLHIHGEYCRHGRCVRCPLGSGRTRVGLHGWEAKVDGETVV